jgi:predicted MFS family arabinose efflux permease
VLRLVPLLIGVAFLDELASGIPFVGSPEIKSEFGVSYAEAAGWSLFAITALGFVLEPPLFLLSDRLPRRWFVCGGLALLGAVCIGAGLAPSYGFLIVALLLYGPLSGCGVALAQATLADASRDGLERALLRWTFAGALGDLATPSLIAVAALFAAGWRTSFVAAGVVLIGYAALLWTRSFPESRAREDDEPAHVPLRSALASALREPLLVRWAIGVSLCALLDELMVAFASLYLRDVLELSLAERTAALSAEIAGAIVGLAAGEALLRRIAPLRLLLASAALCAASWFAFLSVESAGAASFWLFATGALAALQYPIAKAQAYRALPGRSGAVNAVLTLFGVIELPLPILIGVVADHHGLGVALAALAIQPLGLVILVASRPRHT